MRLRCGCVYFFTLLKSSTVQHYLNIFFVFGVNWIWYKNMRMTMNKSSVHRIYIFNRKNDFGNLSRIFFIEIIFLQKLIEQNDFICYLPIEPSTQLIKWFSIKFCKTLSLSPESIDNCTKDDLRCDFLQPPQKHLSPALEDINKFWRYYLTEVKHAIVAMESAPQLTSVPNVGTITWTSHEIDVT